MVSRILLAAAASLALAGQSNAQAPGAPPQPAEPAAPAAQDRGEAWIASVARWMQPIGSVSQRQATVVIGLLEGEHTATDYLEKKSVKEGAAWADSWAKARAIELDTLQADSNALTEDLPPPPASLAKDPQVQTIQASLSTYRRAVRANTDRLLILSRHVLTLISAAAGGDDKAAIELAQRSDELTIAMLSAEVANVQAGTAMLRSSDPERDVATCNIEGDLALIAIMQAKLDGKLSTGKAATAATARQHARAALAAAEQMALDAQSQLARLKAEGGGLSPEFVQRVTRSLETYAESAEVERQVAKALLVAADHVEKGDLADSPEAKQALTSLAPLVERRVAIDTQRNRIMAGQT